jgi:hypothetical protein
MLVDERDRAIALALKSAAINLHSRYLLAAFSSTIETEVSLLPSPLACYAAARSGRIAI